MFEELAGKKVLFVTTKNLDYLRNTQEIRLLQQAGASVTVIGTREKSYPVRLLKVFFPVNSMMLCLWDLPRNWCCLSLAGR